MQLTRGTELEDIGCWISALYFPCCTLYKGQTLQWFSRRARTPLEWGPDSWEAQWGGCLTLVISWWRHLAEAGQSSFPSQEQSCDLDHFSSSSYLYLQLRALYMSPPSGANKSLILISPSETISCSCNSLCSCVSCSPHSLSSAQPPQGAFLSPLSWT